MKKTSLLYAAAFSLLIAAGCKKEKSTGIMPSGPKPAWGQDIKPEMQVVIEKLASFGDTPLPQLTAVQARKIILLPML